MKAIISASVLCYEANRIRPVMPTPRIKNKASKLVTMIKDWSMVYLFGKPDGSDLHERWGRVVIGTVIMDGSQSASPDTYICSAPIVRSPGKLARTRNGHSFSLFGEGKEVELPVTQLSKLRSGVDVEQILQELAHPIDSDN